MWALVICGNYCDGLCEMMAHDRPRETAQRLRMRRQVREAWEQREAERAAQGPPW